MPFRGVCVVVVTMTGVFLADWRTGAHNEYYVKLNIKIQLVQNNR